MGGWKGRVGVEVGAHWVSRMASMRTKYKLINLLIRV